MSGKPLFDPTCSITAPTMYVSARHKPDAALEFAWALSFVPSFIANGFLLCREHCSNCNGCMLSCAATEVLSWRW